MKKNSLYVCVYVARLKVKKTSIWHVFKCQKNIDFFQVQKSKKHRLRWVQRSKKHRLRWVQRSKKHRFLSGSKVKKTSSEMGSRVKKTSISSRFKSQKNMVWDVFKGRKNIDFFGIQKLKNLIPSTVGRIMWKKKFVCVCSKVKG